jgi:hexosaminidase
MRIPTLTLLAALGICPGCITHQDPLPVADATLSLIPMPAHIERSPGGIHVDVDTPVLVAPGNAKIAAVAQGFVDRLQAARGLTLKVQEGAGSSAGNSTIEFALGADSNRVQGDEGYEITMEPGHIRVLARAPHGLFNGGVTLWQLLTQRVDQASTIEIPMLHIIDAPRFAWRGAMLDSARHFQSPEFIKKFIEQLALAKLNTFHWHLTDDQGWRIEIKKYPRLTSVGAWRRPAGAAGSEPDGQAIRYGGFYTRDEIRDIVRYAAERFVSVVPEIDMPGHMQAAIAAYPALGSAGDTPVVSPDWGVHSYLLNVDESTFDFIGNVLDEVTRIFPSAYIHIGGDEAVKDQWKASPRIQKRMHELGLRDENALQGWFVARLQKMLEARGRKLIGWDEILEGELSTNATVMSWRGTGGGIDAAHKGHDVVMAPSPDLYLDNLQSDADDEPSGRPDLRTLADIYAFEPTPANMDVVAAKHVLGAQANLWTEHMRTADLVEHAAFPRLAALAEVLWSPNASHSWNSFVDRLGPQMDRYAQAQVAAAPSAFEVRFTSTYNPAAGRVKVALANQLELPMRYTVDGSSPTARSQPYRDALDLAVPAEVHAVAMSNGRLIGNEQVSRLTRKNLLARSDVELKQCSGKLVLRLQDDAPIDGQRAYFNVDLFDPCWIYAQAPLDGIGALEVEVGQLPFNFQLSHDAVNVVPRAAARTSAGELVVRVDSCAGAVVASFDLASATGNPAISILKTGLAMRRGRHDLCFTFTGPTNNPLWAIKRVQLLPGVSRSEP